MKTPKELIKEYGMITGTISTDPDYEHSYYVFEAGLKNILNERNREFKKIFEAASTNLGLCDRTFASGQLYALTKIKKELGIDGTNN